MSDFVSPDWIVLFYIMAPSQLNAMHNINDQTKNLNITAIEFQLVSLVSSLYTIVLLLNLIWIVLAFYFMI